MKNLKLAGFEIYFLQESLKHYKLLIAMEESPQNSIVTKGYVESMIAQLQDKLKEITFKEQLREEDRTAKSR